MKDFETGGPEIGPSESNAKLVTLATDNLGADVFYTPYGDTPVCNSKCAGCYVFNSFVDGEETINAAAMPDVLAGLKDAGYEKPFPACTEALLAANWKDILAATGDTYINTNGKIIASKGEALLPEIAGVGVTELVLTASMEGMHDDLNLTPPTTVQKAFDAVHAFNEGSETQLKAIGSIIVTSANHPFVLDMIDYAHDVLGAHGVKILGYVPMTGGLLPGIGELAPTKAQLANAIEQVQAAREKYGKAEFYIQRAGTLGSQGLSAEKLQKYCPAGDSIHTIVSMEEGADFYPCIFAPKTPIGKIVDGKPVVDQAKLDAFLEYKDAAVDAGYCPAFASNTILSSPEQLPEGDPSVVAMALAFEKVALSSVGVTVNIKKKGE